VDSLVRTLQAASASQPHGSPLSPTVTATVGPLAAGAATGDVAHDDGEQGRRLTSSSSTFIAVNAQQIHELPNGHSCSNTGFVESHPRLVRLDASGPKLSVAPTVASSDISLASISAKDFTVSEIQRMANPIKVVHDASCSSAPTVEMPLNTNFAGTLTVQGTDVGAALAAAATTSSLTWTDLTLASGMTGGATVCGGTPAWAIDAEGIVHIKGFVRGPGGSFDAPGDLFTLPTSITPTRGRYFLVAASCDQPSSLVSQWCKIVFKSSGTCYAEKCEGDISSLGLHMEVQYSL